MKGHNGSWWGWLFAAFVLMAVFGESDIPVLPLVIGFFILANVLGRRRGVSSHQHHGRTGGHGPLRRDGSSRPDALGPTASTPRDSPMPTIDVPRYPGDVPVTGPPPPTPYGGPAEPSPSRASELPGEVATPPTGAGVPHTSTDPVVSLGQLHLARCGRDLQAAVRQGTSADVARVLDEIRDLSRRMQDMVGAAEGTPGSGRREFRTGLRAIDKLVEDARGEHPPGARLTRLTQACLRMGQTGRHE